VIFEVFFNHCVLEMCGRKNGPKKNDAFGWLYVFAKNQRKAKQTLLFLLENPGVG
jgi:hypothetical protein